MDIAAYLQRFENSFSSYSGDDPLDPWDKFVEYLEQKVPADSSSGMSLVFDTLVQKFLNVERYANDIRYVKHCIKCASYYSDPITLYSHIFSKGVGTRTAALYVAWAQQFEQRGVNEQAEAVYQKAVENQAQPADTVLHEYRQFQARNQLPVSGSQTPLQSSQLTNQMVSHQEPQNKTSVECLQGPAIKTTITVSRSETSGAISSRPHSNVQVVSAYLKDELVCEGSELCFEEVRAKKYFRALREKQEKEERELQEKKLKEEEENNKSIKSLLEKINQELKVCEAFTGQASSQRLSAAETALPNPNPSQQAFGRPRPSNHRSSLHSLGLRLHTEPAFIHEAAVIPEFPRALANTLSSEVSHHSSVAAASVSTESAVQHQSSLQSASFVQANLSLHRNSSSSGVNALSLEPQLQLSGEGVCRPAEHHGTHLDGSQPAEPEEKLDLSQGGTANLSHITPNNSLGFVQATPSRVLPSPTVNTREALGVIMDMFQAPTFLEDRSHFIHAEEEPEAECPKNGGVSSLPKPPTMTPFTIYEDENDKENCSTAAPSATKRSKPAEFTVFKAQKPNDTPPELIPDESTMWGARYNSLNSLAACPNSTSDFAMLAQCVSTPFANKTPFSGNFYQDQENGDADEAAFTRRQTKKLSPIMEQSPCDDKFSETAISQLVSSSARQGTIVGEGLAAAQHCLTTSSITMVQPPPPAALSFRDQTLCPTDTSRTAGPGWEVYTSPEQPSKAAAQASARSEPFKIMEDLDRPASPERAQKQVYDVPMSPDCLKPDWLTARSLEATMAATAEPDLDAFLSPHRPQNADISSAKTLDIPMSPEPPQLCADVPMSPTQTSMVDQHMMSPDRGLNASVTVRSAAARLVSDPWNDVLISTLLSRLSPPLTSQPHCITWQCKVPNITPKMTISMGRASLRVDCVLGKGAFATVYQATDPMTSEKMILKVQKPASPWEFYISTQLDARLRPDVRHLYSNIRSAHLFENGSVLLGELHSYGTLLNAVNIYRNLSDKVMPQPLVLYFTICILHMVEQLHSIRIIHADIKPDNFLLGERFLENRCFDSESVDHGLVLIDLGQSIDMGFFPEGTAFTAKCMTSGFQCTEMLSGKPWNYQTDLFGIAGTVYCMLFGTYMQVTNDGGVWRTNGVFRRNPHGDLWLEFFHALLNVPDCGSLPDLRSLRCKLASVLQQNYSSKLATLKSRLVVLLLEHCKAARR